MVGIVNIIDSIKESSLSVFCFLFFLIMLFSVRSFLFGFLRVFEVVFFLGDLLLFLIRSDL